MQPRLGPRAVLPWVSESPGAGIQMHSSTETRKRLDILRNSGLRSRSAAHSIRCWSVSRGLSSRPRFPPAGEASLERSSSLNPRRNFPLCGAPRDSTPRSRRRSGMAHRSCGDGCRRISASTGPKLRARPGNREILAYRTCKQKLLRRGLRLDCLRQVDIPAQSGI